jgi:hypothetical protein
MAQSKTLALLVEWKWSRGELATPTQRFVFAAAWLEHLDRRFGRGYRAPSTVFRGLEEINADISRTLKALSYGGREPSAVAPARAEWLGRWFDGQNAEFAVFRRPFA